MTFVLSQISQNGIIMASDSSETWTDPDTGNKTYIEFDKTLYFSRLNVGVSTWGDAQVGEEEINEWLDRTIAKFNSQNLDGLLRRLADYIASKLNDALKSGKMEDHEHHMGLHIAGYDSSESQPVICHVFIEPDSKGFEAQMTMPVLSRSQKVFHLRNGMYREFATMWPALFGVDQSLRTLFAEGYRDELIDADDPIALESEWLGNWVKQVCLVSKTAGLPEYIGKTVKILAFDKDCRPRWFHIKEMEEISQPNNCMNQPRSN